MNRIGMWCLGLLFPLWAYAQIQRDYRMVSTERVENKAYYFTALLQELRDVDSLVCNDSALKQLGAAKLQRLKEATTLQERVEAMKFSAEEVEEAGKALARLYRTGNPLDRLLTEHLLPSGCYQQYNDCGAALLEKIWRQDAEGMNYAVEVYAAARKPHYPQIDSIGFDIHSQRFVEEILPACQQNIAFQAEKHPSFLCDTPAGSPYVAGCERPLPVGGLRTAFRDREQGGSCAGTPDRLGALSLYGHSGTGRGTGRTQCIHQSGRKTPRLLCSPAVSPSSGPFYHCIRRAGTSLSHSV